MREDTGRGVRGTGQTVVGGAIGYLLAVKMLGWGDDPEAIASVVVLASATMTWVQLLIERTGKVRRLWR